MLRLALIFFVLALLFGAFVPALGVPFFFFGIATLAGASDA